MEHSDSHKKKWTLTAKVCEVLTKNKNINSLGLIDSRLTPKAMRILTSVLIDEK